MTRSDDELVIGIAAGDQAAFAEFYDRHAPRVLGLLQRWVGDRTDAEEVLQDVFWQVWRKAETYDSQRAKPVSWLFLIAQSRAVDSRRRQRSRDKVRPEPQSPTTVEPLSEIEFDESAQRVKQALERLPAEQRRAITLAFYDGLSYEQVAQQDEIPVGTAKTRIRLGMRRLRDHLRPFEET